MHNFTKAEERKCQKERKEEEAEWGRDVPRSSWCRARGGCVLIRTSRRIYTWSVNHGVNNLSRSYRSRSASAVTGVGESPAKTVQQLSDISKCKFDRRLQVKCGVRNSARGRSELSIGSIVADHLLVPWWRSSIFVPEFDPTCLARRKW